MTIKLLGAAMIIFGCGGFGLLICVAYQREEEMLRQLIYALDHMQHELKYRLTPLPELTEGTSRSCKGKISRYFHLLSAELSKQTSTDVLACVQAVLTTEGNWPVRVGKCLDVLSMSLGAFDAQGQLQSLEAVRELCAEELNQMEENRTVRLRSYQTLGLCAGAALVILLV